MADADPKIDQHQGRAPSPSITIERGCRTAREEEARLGPHYTDAQRAAAARRARRFDFWLTSAGDVLDRQCLCPTGDGLGQPDVTGRIVAVNVRENQRVKAGDVLFRIDPEPFRLAAGPGRRGACRRPRADRHARPPTPAAPMPTSRVPNADIKLAQARPMIARKQALMKQGRHHTGGHDLAALRAGRFAEASVPAFAR